MWPSPGLARLAPSALGMKVPAGLHYPLKPRSVRQLPNRGAQAQGPSLHPPTGAATAARTTQRSTHCRAAAGGNPGGHEPGPSAPALHLPVLPWGQLTLTALVGCCTQTEVTECPSQAPPDSTFEGADLMLNGSRGVHVFIRWLRTVCSSHCVQDCTAPHCPRPALQPEGGAGRCGAGLASQRRGFC